MSPAPFILASTSRYRAELLSRLGLPFTAMAPAVDEAARPRESGSKLAQRLARQKAEAVAAQHPEAWVLGSDQVCISRGKLLGKPGSAEAAVAQLQWMRGHDAAFVTAVCLMQASSGRCYQDFDTTVVRMRRLTDAEVQRYVEREPALDCAGAAKIEGLGITLMREVQSRDPTALIGLPLIITARLLRRAGYQLP